MLQQLFKLIWKRKKSNFFMALEIWVSFLILFAVWSMCYYNYDNYSSTQGIKTDNIIVGFLNYQNDSLPNVNGILQSLGSNPEIESFAFVSDNLPFANNAGGNMISVGDKTVYAEVIKSSPEYLSILGLTLIEGDWPQKADPTYPAAVITERVRQELFGSEPAIGKRITLGEGENPTILTVSGVMLAYKHKNDFEGLEFALLTTDSALNMKQRVLIKTKNKLTYEKESRIVNDIKNTGKDWIIEFELLDKMKADQNQPVWLPIIILSIVCLFLLFNVSLGIFGVLFQNIDKRKKEIGIRRAMGAQQSDVFKHFVGEMLVLATFSIVVGIFFAVQFPILNLFDVSSNVYIFGIIASTFSIYCLVLVCALYPSWLAAQLNPVNLIRS